MHSQDYFGKFGEISDVVVMMTGHGPARHSRGFGFVTFTSPKTVEKVSQQRYHQVGDRSVEVKPALSREMMQEVMQDAASGAATVGKPVEMKSNQLQASSTATVVAVPTTWLPAYSTGYYALNSGYMYQGGWVPTQMPYAGSANVPSGVPIYVGHMPGHMPFYPGMEAAPQIPGMQTMPVMGDYVGAMAPTSPRFA